MTVLFAQELENYPRAMSVLIAAQFATVTALTII